MRNLLFLLLAISLCACAPKPATLTTAPTPDSVTNYLIGYTGGWGGGPAYKLADGKLYESVDQHNPGTPEATVNGNTFKVLKSATGLQAVKELAEKFNNPLVSGIQSGFTCPEAAYDGVCPYFIIVEGDFIRGWTLSEKGTYSPAFKSFMEDVGEALTKM